MQPLSNDLRKRILDAVDNKEGSRRKLAARFKVNTSTITKLLRLRRQTGSYEPRPHAGGVAPTLDGDALQRLRKLVEETPDATLDALRQQMGISGSRMIICRALQKLGLSLKKKSPHASERDTPDGLPPWTAGCTCPRTGPTTSPVAGAAMSPRRSRSRRSGGSPP